MGTMRTSRGLARYGAIGAITVLLVGLALALMRVPAHAAPTVLTVVSTLDDHPGTTCAATCTLRDAVTTANGMTTDATNSVEIDLPSGTISLTQGVLTLGSATNKFSTVKGFSGTPGASTIHQTTAAAGVFATSNDPGLTTSFQDLTISGGRRTGSGGGVFLAGGAGSSATFTNCILTDNTATVSGGAIAVSGTGTVSLTVTSSTVTGNQAQNSGAGVYFTGGGTLTIARSLFDTNSAGAGGLPGGQGGAIWKSGPAAAGISLSTFTNNSVVDGTSEGRGIGGAVFNDAGAMTISLSRFVGNTATAQGSALLQESSAGSIVANNNWWGANAAPGSAVARDSLGSPLGAVPTTTAWLQLRNIAAPSQIQPGGTTTVTADLLGVTGTSTTPLAGGSLVGLAPLPAVFSNAVNGSLSAPSPQFVGGVATATFTGTAPGPASAGATADAATVSATVQVNPATTTTTVISSHNPSVFGQGVTFTATVTSTFAGGTPTGTVQFFVDGVDRGTVTLASGSATSSQIANMTVTSHNVTATYAGNATYGVSTGTVTPAQTVNRAGTTTGVTSSANASAFGQPVAFTATVVPIAPGGGTPVGNVAFFLDGQPLETVALSDGSATTTPLSNLTVATHIVTAVYPDTVSYITSTGTLPGGQTVNKSDTTTTVGSSVTPSKFGQPVSFTATVSPTAPGAGTPAGNVSFFVDGTFLVTRTLVSGAATTASISNLAVGSHPVTATYAGNGTFNTNTSGTLAQVVDHADTTTTVTSGKTPTVFGEPVTFTATVLPVVPGAGTPTGQVQFFHDGSSFGTATVTSGQATSTISSLTAGTHPVTATYSGDPSFNLSTGATSQVVNPADTSVAVSSSLNASIVGQNVQFTATVTATAPGAGMPVGTVQFKDGSTNIGVSQTLDGGVASVSTSSFTFGTHPITAQYAGNANFNGSTGTLAGGQVVNRATTTTGVISSHNPSAIGQGVTFTATVTSTYDGGTPTGIVQFFVDGVDKGTVTMTSGSATSSQIANMAAGIHNVTATYGGNATYDVSTGTVTPAQVVGKAGTTTAIASTPNPSEVTETVTFTATVAATPPGVGTPAGDVQFFVDGSTSGSPATLDEGGVATLPGVAFSTPGAHPVTATYLGNIDFVTSTSSPLSQVVKGFRTTTAVTSPVNPSLYGQPVTFTATVDSGGHGTPTGTVQFSIDGSDVGGGVTLTAGAAVSLP
ncbi:MAG: hypothetical protein QOD49_458, partial [Actinomycetota bacterium]|nr:hypothetical protein [Actinomycetota bacterium]